MMIGRKKPKAADMAGGRTPETNANEPGDAFDQAPRKPTYADIWHRSEHKMYSTSEVLTDDKLARMDMTKSGIVLKKQTRTINKKPMILF